MESSTNRINEAPHRATHSAIQEPSAPHPRISTFFPSNQAVAVSVSRLTTSSLLSSRTRHHTISVLLNTSRRASKVPVLAWLARSNPYPWARLSAGSLFARQGLSKRRYVDGGIRPPRAASEFQARDGLGHSRL